MKLIKVLLFILSFLQLSFVAYASKGLLVYDDYTMDYFENDKFIRKLSALDSLNISFTGDFYYLIKKNSTTNEYFIEKWSVARKLVKVIKTNAKMKNKPEYFSFANNGNGFIKSSDNKIDIYINDKYIKSVNLPNLEEYEGWGPFSTNDALYQTIYSWLDSQDTGLAIYKCSIYGSNCNMGSSANSIDGVSILINIGNNGNKAAISYDMMAQMTYLILIKNDEYANTKVIKDEKYRFISVTDDSIYYTFSNNNIIKCDSNIENCNGLNLSNKYIKFAFFK